MSLVRQVFLGHLLAAVAALAAGYALAGYWMFSVIFVLLGALWFVARARKTPVPIIASLMLVILLAGCAVGILFTMPGWLALIATVAAMGAWDLDHFLQRLGLAAQVNLDAGLGREHLKRLFLVEAVGLLAGLAALTFRARLPFWWEVLLVILAVIGIGRLIGLVRRLAGD